MRLDSVAKKFEEESVGLSSRAKETDVRVLKLRRW